MPMAKVGRGVSKIIRVGRVFRARSGSRIPSAVGVEVGVREGSRVQGIRGGVSSTMCSGSPARGIGVGSEFREGARKEGRRFGGARVPKLLAEPMTG